MEQIGFLQLLKVAVYGFIVQCAVLRLQIVRNGFGREGIPYIVESVFHHSLQLVNLANLITLYNVRENGGVINVTDNSVNLVLRVVLQMGRWKAAKADIVR